MRLNISELDCIFISYDEPNAEQNWIDLVDKCFWAKRVHGVKGSNECHQAAAQLSDTDWFITIDADNVVNTKFFDQIIDIPKNIHACSWPGVNVLNGLCYGNGSVKAWKKSYVLNMKSHEASTTENGAVDFCWDNGYRPMVDSYSITYPNASAYQAWRAGFREGVKMSLVNGVKQQVLDKNKMHWHNLHRLKIWMNVGAHANNGLWAILGARHGCYKINCTDWNYLDVRDFSKLSEIWKEVYDIPVLDSILKFGDRIKLELGIDNLLLDASTSEFVAATLSDQYTQVKEQMNWINARNNV